jgi:hypothetical protein
MPASGYFARTGRAKLPLPEYPYCRRQPLAPASRKPLPTPGTLRHELPLPRTQDSRQERMPGRGSR